MQEQLKQFCRQKSIQLDPTLTICQNIKQILADKERIIDNLSQQLAKSKYELLKSEKLVKSLQDKINQIAPNISNTGSNFMMASQFKAQFEEFITTILPTSLSSLTDRPHLFSKCTEDIFAYTYTSITAQVKNILGQICSILKIDHLKGQQNDLQNKIKLNLLKILQQFWMHILPYNQNDCLEYASESEIVSSQLLDQMNELIKNEEYGEMQKQLYTLCVYMVLQEKEWEFINLNSKELIKFNKKQHTCIDGWVKEGSHALLVLGGLKKQGHTHPNLKNYVIPISQEEQLDYKTITLKRKQDKKGINQSEKLLSPPKLYIQTPDQQKEVQILMPVFQNSQVITNNKSIQFLNNKQNIPHHMNKKSKKKDKLKFSVDSSLNMHQKSPSKRHNEQFIKNKKYDQTIKSKKNETQQIDSKIFLIKEEPKGKKKSLAVSKHYDLNQNIIPNKEKDILDLPMTKQPNPKKRPKANTSRKNSVGKIVNQNHIINADKENTQINSSKNKNKEKVYKDIIKEKLLDEKIGEKTQYSLNILFPKPRTDREKKKQENRPLKIQNNTNKLREKYIF